MLMPFGFDEAFSIGSSLFDAALGHYESVRDQHFQSDEAKAQRAWQQQENQRNRDWQEQMYLQYNTPSAMKQQFKDAGYNPYLMMSQNQMGNGMSASPSSGSGVAAHGGSLPPGSRLAENYLASIGVQANAANQQAKTVQQEWETYQFIRQHVGSDAAKKYLDSHPEMVRSNSPDNDPWMRAYRRSEVKENIANESAQWEYNLRQLYGVKQAELEMRFINQKTDDLLSQISLRSANEKEVEKNIKLILEKIKTEKSVQSRNYSEGSLASAKAKTEDESRMHVVNMLLSRSNILDRLDQSDLANFESQDALRAWLRSPDGRAKIRDAARAAGVVNSDLMVKALFMLLGDFNLGLGVGAGLSSGESSIYSTKVPY